jgi:O-antigen ligase
MAFFVGLIFSFRAVSSIAIGVLIIAGIVKNKLESKPLVSSRFKNPFTFLCTVFFLLQLISIVYTHDRAEAWDHVRIKSGLLFIPLAICCTDFINRVTRPKLFLGYSILLIIACLYCLVMNFSQYLESHDLSLFFYHPLVHPLFQHAVFFSILVCIALVFLLEDRLLEPSTTKKAWAIPMIVFFSLFLFLLSSKLVIGFYLLYLVCFFIRVARSRKITGVMAIGLFIVLIGIITATGLTRNPIRERFKDITYWDTRWMHPGQYSPGDYFNGLQFRLLQWKLVTEILQEKKQWLAGVTPGDAQALLDAKYISKNMYRGDPERKDDRGYLGYHTHNQFLQSLLQNGIIGLFVFAGICVALVRMAWKARTWETGFTISLLLTWCFTDAVFETQYGLLIFTFFPLFICSDRNPGKATT